MDWIRILHCALGIGISGQSLHNTLQRTVVPGDIRESTHLADAFHLHTASFSINTRSSILTLPLDGSAQSDPSHRDRHMRQSDCISNPGELTYAQYLLAIRAAWQICFPNREDLQNPANIRRYCHWWRCNSPRCWHRGCHGRRTGVGLQFCVYCAHCAADSLSTTQTGANSNLPPESHGP